MKRNWSMDEIIEHFTLLPTELQSLGMKDPHNQFGKALLLKFFQYEGRFPESILCETLRLPCIILCLMV